MNLHQKKPLGLAIAALVLVSGLYSCSSLPGGTKYIPKESVFVAGFNGKSLSQKANWDSLAHSDMFRIHPNEKEGGPLHKVFDSLFLKGLDLKTHFYIFFNPNKQFGSGYIGLVGTLKDPSGFSKFLLRQDPSLQIHAENGIQWAGLQAMHSVMGWKGKTILLLGYQEGKPGSMEHMADSSSDRKDTLAKGDLSAELRNLFTLDRSQSVESLVPFSDLEQKKSDMTLWVNLEQVYSHLPLTENPLMAMMVKPEIYKGSYYSATLDFEDGQVTMHAYTQSSKEVTPVIKNLASRKVDMNLIKNIPSGNLDFLFASSFNPQGLKDLFKLLGVDGILNAALTRQNLALDDILNAVNGNMILAVTDLRLVHSPVVNPMDTTKILSKLKPHIHWIFGMGLGNQSALEKILGWGIQHNFLQKQGNTYTLSGMADSARIGFVETPTLLTLASSPDLASQFSSGNHGKTDPQVQNIFQGKNFGLYINFQALFHSGDSAMPAGRSQKHLAALRSFLRDAYLNSDGFHGDIYQSTGVLRLMDPKVNSLQQFLNLIQKFKGKGGHFSRFMPGLSSHADSTAMKKVGSTNP